MLICKKKINKMKKYINIFILFLVVFSYVSCQDVLNKRDLGAVDGSLIYGDSTLARLNVDYIYYSNLPDWGGTWGLRGDLSEESSGESKYFEGTLLNTDVADFGTANSSSTNYGKIRTINEFYRDINNGSITGGARKRLVGQAFFFRAWRYFELVKLYGGVPLVLKPMDAVGDAAKELAFLPRNKTSECITQICADLDSSIAYLPAKWAASSDWGRITSGAAAALKGRVLLYWASPEFNPTDKIERWQAAYDANLLSYNLLKTGGFGLHASYDNLWFQEVNNPEAVFVTCYNTSKDDQLKKNNGYDNSTRPSYLGSGGGSNQPSWDLVKSYPMKDGKKAAESAKYPYTDQLYYKNRDPRFDKTIAYNGCTWPLLSVPTYKLWTYYVANKTVETKASSTGFYLRKAINTTTAISDLPYSGTDWIEIRFAEVVLNLAESACGVSRLGDTQEAYAGLKDIRKRAGIEVGSDNMYGLTVGLTRAQMFDAILYERQIEFAFEGKRFWDLRRWKLFESTLNGKKRTGVNINLKTTGIPSDFATKRDTYVLDDVYSNYYQSFVTSGAGNKILDTKYAINWKPEYYFFAIPQAAVDNNPKLEQNKGWVGGTFDPLL